MQLIERRIENDQHVVVLRYAAAFYWLMWPTLLVTVLSAVMSHNVVDSRRWYCVGTSNRNRDSVLANSWRAQTPNAEWMH